MKKISSLSVLVLFSLSLFAQSPGIEAAIGQFMAGLPDKAEVSIGLTHNGKTYRYGYSKAEGKVQTKKNENAIFEIGSITKTFTATLLMEQVENGSMQLDGAIQQYLPVSMKQPTYEGHSISLKHLATHTSGLNPSPGSFLGPFLKSKLFAPQNPYKYMKAKHYYRYLKGFKLNYVPGKKWVYNNAAIGLLGELVARQQQSTWETLVQEKLFEPLGMNNSYFRITKELKGRMVQGYNAKGKKAALWEMDFINPAGVIKSTLNDMMKWLAAQLAPPTAELKYLPATHRELDIPMPLEGHAMGIGWVHKIIDEDTRFLWHNGGTGGYHSFLGFDKGQGNGAVILTNISSSHPQMKNEAGKSKVDALGFELLRLLREAK